ncbi:MAG: DDE-type integrase/transposase/recombinase [Chloroflexi bacterium]|nr:DDE-type integrase/transposase/recombinase [Chloroflexota bacterium]
MSPLVLEVTNEKTNGRISRVIQSTSGQPAAPNQLAQDFGASQPAEKWCGDITYVWTAVGWLYLAVVIDLYSCRIVGWAMNARMTAQLVRDAFQMAWRQCRPQAGLLFHSDRGSQYTSQEFQRLLQACQVKASMSGTGNCYRQHRHSALGYVSPQAYEASYQKQALAV